VAASCGTSRKDRTQLHDALLSRGPIAKTGATLRSVRKSFRGACFRQPASGASDNCEMTPEQEEKLVAPVIDHDGNF
jgi:hypothetical protein